MAYAGPQMKDQRGAYQGEANAGRDQCNEHGGKEDRKDNEGASSRDAPRMIGDVYGSRQNLMLEDVVGDVDAYEQSRIEHDGGGGKLGARDPCGSEG